MGIKATSQITLTDVTDAYSVSLTSEAYTFVGNTVGAPAGLSCKTQVVAYHGTDKCSNVNVTSVTCPTGISSVISNNNTSSPTITFTTTDTITSACEATINIQIDGLTFAKMFSFAVAKEGSFPDDWYADADKTYINGGKIYTGSITADQLNTNAIKSRNYVAGQTGTFLNLEDGSIDTKNFKIDGNGNGLIGGWTIADGILKGVPINDEKISMLINSKKNTITISDDGSILAGDATANVSYGNIFTFSPDGFSTSNITISRLVQGGMATKNILLGPNIVVNTGGIAGYSSEMIKGSPISPISVHGRQPIYDQATFYLEPSSGAIKGNSLVLGSPTNATFPVSGSLTCYGTVNASTLQQGGTNISDLFAVKTHNHAGVYAPVSHSHSYLPLSGGTITGVLNTGTLALTGNSVIHLNTAHAYDAKLGAYWSDGRYHNIIAKPAKSNNVDFGIANVSGVSSTTSLKGNTVRIYSHTKGAVYLGSSGSTAITSDENLKDLYDMDDRYEEFFMNLEPKAYIYKQNGHRKHMGFGARQVEDSLLKSGLTTEEFAGILKDTDVTISADEAGTDSDQHYDELYSLRYEEFIALNTRMIQKLMKRVDELEKKLANQ